MAIRFLSSETIDGALTVNSTVTLNKTNNVINIPSLVDNGKFLQVTQVGNETWEFKCESLSGSLDGVTIGTTPGKVAFDENGQIQSIQLLDVATAGGRLTGFSNRGYLSSIHLEQTATNTDGGYIRFLTAASGTTSGLERFKITETGAFSVGPSGTNYGTSGQVLTSQGNALPTWTTPTTGTITGSGTADKVTKFTSATAIGDGPITFATNDSTFAGHVGIGVTAHATASLNITNANQHIRLNNGSELGIISLDSDGKLDLWAHGDGETIDFRTGTGTGTVAMSVVGTNVAIQPGGATLTNTRLYVVSADNYNPTLYDGMGGIRIGSGGSSSAGDGNYTGGIGFAITSGTSGIAGVQKGADADKQGLAFFTHPSDTGGDAAVEKMRLDADGNLGIGTTSPDMKLDVAGNIRARVAGNVAGGFYIGEGDTSEAFGLLSQGANGYFKIRDEYNSADRFYISHTGNVGIGTTTPNYKLSVANASTRIVSINYQDSINTIMSHAGSPNYGLEALTIRGDYIAFYTDYDTSHYQGLERMRITSAGDVGIGYSSPSYKLDVNGVTRTRGFLQESNIFEDVADTTYFTNATADQNVDIIIGNISMWGYIEISITGTYSHQSTPGKLTKLYAVGLNTGGTIYANDSRIVDAIGPINANIYLDDLRWDSTVSQYRIRVAHIVSTGNQYSIKINAFSHSTGALNLAGWSISGLYTQSTSGLASQYPYYTSHLGIGTTSPAHTLDVQKSGDNLMALTGVVNGGVSSIEMRQSRGSLSSPSNSSANGDGNYIISQIYRDSGYNTAGHIGIVTGATTDDGEIRFSTALGGTVSEKMRIDENGNVGIGTTSPERILHLDADQGRPIIQLDKGGDKILSMGTGSSATGADDTIFQMFNEGSELVRIFTEGNSWLNGGNVGIGTTSPGAQLHNYSTATADIFISGYGTTAQNDWRAEHAFFVHAGNGIIVGKANANNDTNRLYTFYNDASGNAEQYIYNTSNTATIKLDSAGVSYLNGGNVGFGNTTPLRPVDITADSGAVCLNLRARSANDYAFIQWSNHDRSVYYGETYVVASGGAATSMNWNVGTTHRMSLDNSGDLTVTGDVVAYGSPSDKKLKENIHPIENALEKVIKLQGVKFDWKKSESILDLKEDMGFIAQDVQKVLPELVRENEDGKLSMRHQGVIPILVEAMKEQQKQIDRLEEQIKKMSSKN